MVRLPRHKAPVLHERAGIVSYENCYKLGKIYREIIGVNNVDHFSLNIVNTDGKMFIFSYNPQIVYDILKDGSYLYNGSISPSYYNNFDSYTWDETYDPRFRETLLNKMERKNGINKGVVFIKRHNGLILLFSFATKGNGQDFESQSLEQKEKFYQMGNHCFDLAKPIVDDNILIEPIITNNEKNPQQRATNVIRLVKNV